MCFLIVFLSTFLNRLWEIAPPPNEPIIFDDDDLEFDPFPSVPPKKRRLRRTLPSSFPPRSSLISRLASLDVFDQMSRLSVHSPQSFFSDLANRCRRRRISPRFAVTQVGHASPALFILVHGRLGVHSDNGTRISTLEAPSVFGERSMLAPHFLLRTSTVALEPCLIYELSGRDVENLAEQHGGKCEGVLVRARYKWSRILEESERRLLAERGKIEPEGSREQQQDDWVDGTDDGNIIDVE